MGSVPRAGFEWKFIRAPFSANKFSALVHLPRRLSSANTPRRIFVSPRSRSPSVSDLPRRWHRGLTNHDRTHLSILLPPLFRLSLGFHSVYRGPNADGPFATPTFVSYSFARGRDAACGKNWPRCALETGIPRCYRRAGRVFAKGTNFWGQKCTVNGEEPRFGAIESLGRFDALTVVNASLFGA